MTVVVLFATVFIVAELVPFLASLGTDVLRIFGPLRRPGQGQLIQPLLTHRGGTRRDGMPSSRSRLKTGYDDYAEVTSPEDDDMT